MFDNVQLSRFYTYQMDARLSSPLHQMFPLIINKFKASIYRPIKIHHILTAIWLIDYICTWFKLQNEIELEFEYHKYKSKPPIQCIENKWYSFLLNKIKQKNCIEYYKNIHAKVHILPLTVLNKQFESLIQNYASTIGTAFSTLIEKFLENSSMSTIILFGIGFPMLLILLYMLFCAVGSFLLNRELKINLYGISLNINQKSKQSNVSIEKIEDNINLIDL